MEEIENTITTIRMSILKFNYDIEKDTVGGLSSFLNEFQSLLRAFVDLMKQSPYKEVESYLYFKDEITDIYNYLFGDKEILLIAKNYLLNGDIDENYGRIIAFSRNSNPLDIVPDYRGIIKSSNNSYNPYEDFVNKYSHLYTEERTQKRAKYQGKYYGWYHKILISIGKADRFPNVFGKKEIMNFGKSQYCLKDTGETFYRGFNDFDVKNSCTMVNSMNRKDKASFKNIIIDISNNDSDIISFLRTLPN